MKRNEEDPLYFNTVEVHFFQPITEILIAHPTNGKLLKKKAYVFHLPKGLRSSGIERGSVVVVASKGILNHSNVNYDQAVVTRVWREEFELTDRKYRPVVANLYCDYRGKF